MWPSPLGVANSWHLQWMLRLFELLVPDPWTTPSAAVTTANISAGMRVPIHPRRLAVGVKVLRQTVWLHLTPEEIEYCYFVTNLSLAASFFFSRYNEVAGLGGRLFGSVSLSDWLTGRWVSLSLSLRFEQVSRDELDRQRSLSFLPKKGTEKEQRAGCSRSTFLGVGTFQHHVDGHSHPGRTDHYKTIVSEQGHPRGEQNITSANRS